MTDEKPIPDKPEKETEAEQERRPAAKETDSSPRAPQTFVEIPDSLLQEYRSNQRKQEVDNRKNRRISTWAVVGAWVYALIAAFQLYSSERAYIGILSAQMRTFELGKPVEVSSVLSNVGRTTATHVAPRNGAFFAHKGARIDWGKIAPDLSWSEIDRTQMPLVPGSPYHFPTATTDPPSLPTCNSKFWLVRRFSWW